MNPTHIRRPFHSSISRFLTGLLLLILTQPDLAAETAGERADRMAWWKEARFGMFIHWGVYSVMAGHYKGAPVDGIGEWIMHRAPVPQEDYEPYASMFNPVFFDAREWVKIATNAGMKYIVITSKHHDGFALWDTAVSDWNIVDRTPFGRDVLKELAVACAEAGIRLCFYHSIMDWHHPDAQGPFFPNYNDGNRRNPRFPLYYENHLKPQLTELLTDYGPIGILWFDGEWIPDYTTEMGKELDAHVRSLQPDIIVNNRVDKGRRGMQGTDREGDFAGDYGTPEQEVPDQGLPGVDWETCMTMNQTWGWKGQDHDWKSAGQLLHTLIEVASKGGNFLLNVGPTGEGVIPAPSIDRLKVMGEWLRVNGEAIYGTEASPFAKPTWGAYTRKPEALYAHIIHWPETGILYIPYLDTDRPYRSAEWLGTDSPIKTDPAREGIILHLPDAAPDPIASVIRLRY